MTNNTKQGLIVSVGSLVILFAIGTVMTMNFFRREHAYILSIVKGSLEKSRLEAFAGKSNSVNQGVFSITPAEFSAAVCGTNEGLAPNFWIAKQPVKSMSSDIVCAISWSDNSAYAIDANGTFRELSKEDFAKWPHVLPTVAQRAGATSR
jgi:hypothetical protein